MGGKTKKGPASVADLAFSESTNLRKHSADSGDQSATPVIIAVAVASVIVGALVGYKSRRPTVIQESDQFEFDTRIEF